MRHVFNGKEKRAKKKMKWFILPYIFIYFAAIQCSVADLCVYNQFDLLPAFSDCDMHTVFAIKENITWKPENSSRFFKSIQELWWLLLALFLLD